MVARPADRSTAGVRGGWFAFAFALVGAILVASAISATAPWVAGTDPGCRGNGPNALFLVAWPAGALLGLAGAVLLAAARQQVVRAQVRRAGIALGAAAFGAAAVWLAVVAFDAFADCGV